MLSWLYDLEIVFPTSSESTQIFTYHYTCCFVSESHMVSTINFNVAFLFRMEAFEEGLDVFGSYESIIATYLKLDRNGDTTDFPQDNKRSGRTAGAKPTMHLILWSSLPAINAPSPPML